MARVVITSADGAWARDFQVSENLDLSRLFVGLVRFARFLEANGEGLMEAKRRQDGIEE